ncbi:NAD(P)-binding protein [Trichodelitschia bisporula]|uniref:NAD(P)-binding protein n=1 Tax=Trichodelitschia bisporula TaxID=703511 RepID=A0A6G1HJW9_9PEZI|nr:NAD(P)-binding protein [Trichodelitschia bisporula]
MAGPIPRIAILGAGSRGRAYARALAGTQSTIIAIAEPHAFKRSTFVSNFIRGERCDPTVPGEAFASWEDLVAYETTLRSKLAAGEEVDRAPADAFIVCVLDEQHPAVVKALAPLAAHVLCEKPLAPSLGACLGMYADVVRGWKDAGREGVFGICHVLRYSPHNMLLRRLVREESVVGGVVSVEHTEPVGWWHFAHSYVRGNWRREDTSAPTLLTKSCHDIDFLLWLLATPPSDTPDAKPHLPATVTSSGTLTLHRRARKPRGAGEATNCLSCPVEPTCIHSAKKVYVERHLRGGNTGWPVSIVVPEIEDVRRSSGPEAAEQRLLEVLGEDYGPETGDEKVKGRNWFGRCVFEADNDVCDDQTVVLAWEDGEGVEEMVPAPPGSRPARQGSAPDRRTGAAGYPTSKVAGRGI